MTRQTYSLDQIKHMLLDRFDQVVAHYAPAAPGSHTDFGKYFTLNPGRADRSVGSFVIYMDGPKRGRFNDFASGDHGDVFDLIALSLGCDNAAAIREARTFLGLQTESPEDRRRRAEAVERSQRQQAEARAKDRRDRQRRAKQAQAIWLSGTGLRNTPAEYYLRGRGIDLTRLGRQPNALRFVSDCFYQHMDGETGEVIEGKWPAMVAAITNGAGEFVACHRTYLALDPATGRWGKAPVPKPKKVLGLYPGASINLWRGIGPRGGKPASLANCPPGTRVMIAEGIEDALSTILLLPRARVLAAISLGNLGAVELPRNVTGVTLVADLDENDTARAALDRAVDAHRRAGRAVRLFQNKWGGKDLNDALQAAQKIEDEPEGKSA